MDMTGEHLIVFHMCKNLLREKIVAKVIVSFSYVDVIKFPPGQKLGKKDIKRL